MKQNIVVWPVTLNTLPFGTSHNIVKFPVSSIWIINSSYPSFSYNSNCKKYSLVLFLNTWIICMLLLNYILTCIMRLLKYLGIFKNSYINVVSSFSSISKHFCNIARVPPRGVRARVCGLVDRGSYSGWIRCSGWGSWSSCCNSCFSCSLSKWEPGLVPQSLYT